MKSPCLKAVLDLSGRSAYPTAMTIRQITVSCEIAQANDLHVRLSKEGAKGLRMLSEIQPGRERATVSFIAGQKTRQHLLDVVQSAMLPDGDWRVVISPVDSAIPFPSDEEEAEDTGKAKRNAGQTREEIYNSVWAKAQPSWDYGLMVVLSTLVAAFGMIEDAPAVVVGAMVIAPLLGPNLALAVGVALGDLRLIGRAALTNLAGIAIALALSVAIGMAWPISLESGELLSRRDVGYGGMIVALASGAAAALSLVSGAVATLVGVMVAVALLPPTVAVGLFAGQGAWGETAGAALLLTMNVVCINLAAQTVLLVRGVSPRSWFEKRKARRAQRLSAAFWLVLFAGVVLLLGLFG